MSSRLTSVFLFLMIVNLVLLNYCWSTPGLMSMELLYRKQSSKEGGDAGNENTPFPPRPPSVSSFVAPEIVRADGVRN